MAYTYKLSWTSLDKHYIGSRIIKGSKPSELLVKYKTSSQFVKSFIRENGLPDRVITQCYLLAEDALRAERRMLLEVDAPNNDKYLNRIVNVGGHFITAKNTKWTAKQRELITKSKIGTVQVRHLTTAKMKKLFADSGYSPTNMNTQYKIPMEFIEEWMYNNRIVCWNL